MIIYCYISHWWSFHLSFACVTSIETALASFHLEWKTHTFGDTAVEEEEDEVEEEDDGDIPCNICFIISCSMHPRLHIWIWYLDCFYCFHLALTFMFRLDLILYDLNLLYILYALDCYCLGTLLLIWLSGLAYGINNWVCFNF